MIACRFVMTILLMGFMARPAQAGEEYNFVREYVREIAALETIRAKAELELAQPAPYPLARVADCIRNGQLYQLEMKLDISLLKQIKLPKPLDDTPSLIVEFYEEKLEQYRQMTQICSSLMAGPKPHIDFGQLAADMPKITANIEYLDNSLFKLCPLVFMTLIDQRPDKDNHLSHLIISKAERDALVLDLNLSFGGKMDQNNQNWGVSAASVLKTYLTKKDYKFADDPW